MRWISKMPDEPCGTKDCALRGDRLMEWFCNKAPREVRMSIRKRKQRLARIVHDDEGSRYSDSKAMKCAIRDEYIAIHYGEQFVQKREHFNGMTLKKLMAEAERFIIKGEGEKAL